MTLRRLRVLSLLPVSAGLVIAAAGGTARGATTPLRVVLVLQPGGATNPYQRAAYLGFRRAAEKLGIQGQAVTLTPREDWPSRFSLLGAQHYDLVVGLGIFEAAAIDKAALASPRTRFVLVDVSQAELKHRARNLSTAVFREQEAGYLAGYLAALVEHRRPGRDVVSGIGGWPVPAVQRYLVGAAAGARKAVPAIRLLGGYAKSFTDPAKCRAVALTQIAQGSGVVFPVADSCGLGALEAAREKGVWGVGVDVDQSFLGPHILTSAVKRLDVAVFRTIRMAQQGALPPAGNAVYDVANGGVGLGRISPKVPRAFVTQVERIRSQIATGTIKVPAR